MHKRDLESGMLKQRPMFHIARSNRYQIPAEVDMVKSHFIQSAMEKIAEHCNLHCFEFDAERLEFGDFHLVDNKYLLPETQCGKGGVRHSNPKQQELKAANERRASTLLPGRSYPAIILHLFLSTGKALL